MGVDYWTESGIGIQINSVNIPKKIEEKYEAWLVKQAELEGYKVEDYNDCQEDMIDAILDDYGEDMSIFYFIDEVLPEEFTVKKYGNYMVGDVCNAIVIIQEPFKGGMANLMGNILKFYDCLKEFGFDLPEGIDSIDIVSGTSVG